jgi:hypothetical protein
LYSRKAKVRVRISVCKVGEWKFEGNRFNHIKLHNEKDKEKYYITLPNVALEKINYNKNCKVLKKNKKT